MSNCPQKPSFELFVLLTKVDVYNQYTVPPLHWGGGSHSFFISKKCLKLQNKGYHFILSLASSSGYNFISKGTRDLRLLLIFFLLRLCSDIC